MQSEHCNNGSKLYFFLVLNENLSIMLYKNLDEKI